MEKEEGWQRRDEKLTETLIEKHWTVTNGEDRRWTAGKELDSWTVDTDKTREDRLGGKKKEVKQDPLSECPQKRFCMEQIDYTKIDVRVKDDSQMATSSTKPGAAGNAKKFDV